MAEQTKRRLEREGYREFIKAMGLDEYRYSVWLRFPEWQRSAVVGQVITLKRSENGAPEDPALFSIWRTDLLLKTMPDWKLHLPKETVFNICIRLTPGGLGEGSKWAVVMPKEMIPRYKPGWPTQQEWVDWTSYVRLGLRCGWFYTGDVGRDVRCFDKLLYNLRYYYEISM